MAERVTGILGGQPINLENAASEATLQLILEAIRRSGTSSGGSSSSNAARQETRDRAALTQQINQETHSHRENTESVRQSSDAFNVLSTMLGGLSTAVANIAKLFDNSAVTFNSFNTVLGKVPAVGGVLQSFGTILTSQMDSVRAASRVGIDFGDSLTDVTSKAIQMGSSVDGMLSVLSQQSASLAALTGNATRGANILVDTTEELKKGGFADRMYRLGYSVDELTRYTGSYLEIQQKLGLGQQKGSKELAKGTQEYLLQLDGLARVTGLSKEQLDKQLKDQANDKYLKTLFMNLGPEIKQNVSSSLAVLQSASPEVADAMKELIATGGIPVTEATQRFAALSPQFSELAVALRNGKITSNDFIAGIRNIANNNKLSAADADLQMKMSAAGLNSFHLNAIVALQGIKNLGEGATDAAEAQEKAQAAQAKNMLAIDQVLQNIKNQFVETLINTGAIDKLGEVMASFITFLGNTVKNIDSEKLSNFFDSLSSWDPMTFITDVKNFFTGQDGKLVTAIGAGFLALFAGGALVSMVGSAISTMLGKVGRGVGAGADGLGRGVGSGIGALGQGIGTGIGGVMSGIAAGVKAFATPQALIGLTALTLAINGIAFAIRLAEPGIKPFGESVKTMLDGVSIVVESVFKGITGIIEKFEPGFSALYTNIIKPVVTNVSNAFTWVKDTFVSVFDSMWTFGEKIVNKITNGFNSLGNVFSNFKEIISNMFSVVSPIFNTISTVAGQIVDSVKGFFTMSDAAAATVSGNSPTLPKAAPTPAPAVAAQQSEALVIAINKLNETLKSKAPETESSKTEDLKYLVSLIESVNNRLGALVQIESEIAPVIKQTARNTRSSNMLG